MASVVFLTSVVKALLAPVSPLENPLRVLTREGRVYDTECNTFATIVAENPCMTPELGCSPSPIIFNRFYFEGKVYAFRALPQVPLKLSESSYTCETSSSSGYCSGNTIQVCVRHPLFHYRCSHLSQSTSVDNSHIHP